MKRIIILICLLLVAFSAFVLAEEQTTADYAQGLMALDPAATASLTEDEKVTIQKDILISQLDAIKEDYNSKDQDIPKPLKRFLKDIKINIYLDGDYKIGLVIKDAKIETLQSGEIEDSDMKLYVKDQVFKDMNNNVFYAKKSLNNGDITFEGVGFFNKIKFKTLKFILKIFI